MLSTQAAAQALGISVRRVQALIKDGILDAQKVSGVWLVDEQSVARRATSASQTGGRPAAGTSIHEHSFMLMNRGHEISEVVYNTRTRMFTRIGPLLDKRRTPLGLAVKRGALEKRTFNDWWRGRGIPQARFGLTKLLESAGVEVPSELVNRNLGLGLSDQYWIRPENSGLSWEDVNFFTNDFDRVSVLTHPHAVEGRLAAANPDNTSDGNLEKYWACPGGIRTLFKGGSHYGQEPYNEVVATALHRRLLQIGEYVPYSLAGSGAGALSGCSNFLTDTQEFVPAVYVSRLLEERSDHNAYEHYVRCCRHLGIADPSYALDRMIVCDDILANHDRHFRNFGIVRDVETLECRMAPIFDSGSCLWCDLATEILAAGETSFESKQFFPSPAKQMLLVEDLSWVDLDALDGFVDEACDILAANDALAGRIPHIKRALEWRVARMRNIVEWA